MKAAVSICFLLLGLWGSSGGHGAAMNKYSIRGVAQGTSYMVTYYATVPLIEKEEIEHVLQRMDEVFSLYRDDSWVARFNASTRGGKMIADMVPVWEKAKEAHRETIGICDIAIYPLTSAWRNKGAHIRSRELRRLRSISGMHLLSPTTDSLIKLKSGVKLDTDGIAQGFSVDQLAERLKEKGVRTFVVELGGEVRVQGCKPENDEKMRIAVEAPFAGNSEEALSVKYLFLSKGALTTSGNYRKFIESGGRTKSHIIDPRTGIPVMNELVSVTVYAPDALTADAYDHAIFAMGLTKGLQFVEAHPTLAAFFIYVDKEGMLRDSASLQFRSLLNQSKQCYN